jgi:hypothetical protein
MVEVVGVDTGEPAGVDAAAEVVFVVHCGHCGLTFRVEGHTACGETVYWPVLVVGLAGQGRSTHATA